MAKRIDWEAVEKDWIVGILTGVELSEKYGVSDEGMRKHFKKLGISRDRSRLPHGEYRKVALSPIKQSDPSTNAGFLYVIYIEPALGNRFYKIGRSVSFSDRLSTHQCSSPFEVFVACCYFVPNTRAEEMALHELFEEKRVRGEWFDLDQADLQSIASRSLLA